MAGIWYGAGLDNIEDGTDYWSTAVNIRCALVAAPVATPLNPNNTTLQDFLNEGNSLITGSTDIDVTGRLPENWEASGTIQNNMAFGWNQKLAMGSPTNGTAIAGVIFYDGASTNATAANLIWFHDKPGTAQGGPVNYGANSNNWLGLWGARQNEAGVCGRGSMASIINQPAEWNSAVIVGYSLVIDGDWAVNGVDALFLSNFSGLVYATNCAPGETAFRTRVQAQRGVADYSGSGQALPFPLLQGTEIKFESANGLVAGEVVSAVIEYVWTGAEATSRILRWDAVVPNITIQAGQDLIYSNVVNAAETTRIILV